MARSFASQGSDQVDFSGTAPVLYGQTNATLVCWFKKAASPASGAFEAFFMQKAAFNESASFSFKTTADNGKINILWRTPTQFTEFVSTTAWDDDAWHRLVLVRNNASPFIELFIDGASDGTQTTDPSTDASDATVELVGREDTASTSLGGSLARVAIFGSDSLSVEDADSFLFTGRCSVQPDWWLELGQGSPEPDWSGNGNNGTVTGAAIADHAPCAFPWHDRGWQGAVQGVQIAVPTSDVTFGGWTPEVAGSPSFAGSPTELFAMIDEAAADDSDFIHSALTPVNDTCEVRLQALSDPAASTGHIVRYRYAKNLGVGQVDLTVRLMDGGTEIASWTHTDIGTTETTAAQTLSAGQADSISDYGDLRLRFTADQP